MTPIHLLMETTISSVFHPVTDESEGSHEIRERARNSHLKNYGLRALPL